MQRFRRLVSRAARRPLVWVLAGLLGLLLWLSWLGWPATSRVTGRFTPLVSQEASEWQRVGDDLRTRSARLVGENGLAVELRVVKSVVGDEHRRPVIVLLGGHRTGRDAVDVVGHPGRAVVVALNYPYDGPQRVRGVRQIVGTIPQVRQALVDTPAAVTLALDWVLKQPWAHPDEIELVGVSLGTQLATAAGALDERFRRVWLLHGAGDSRAWLTLQLERRIGFWWIRQATGALLWWLAHGATLEPQRWVDSISPRPVVVVGARQDAGLPPHLVAGLYEAARNPKRLEWTDTGHVNPRRPETVQPLLELILSELE